MAQAVVADLKRRFRHVAFAGSQEFRRPLHANVTEILLNRHASFLREKSAEIKWAAPHHAAEFLERWRLAEFFRKDGPDTLNPFLCRTLLPRTKQFAIRRPEEELRRQFERLALEPQFLGGRENRGMPQAFDQGKLGCPEASG